MHVALPAALLACASLPVAGGAARSLDDLVRTALESNLDLKAAQLGLDSAQGDLGQARGSLDPQVTLGPEWNRNNVTLVNPQSVPNQGLLGYTRFGLNLAGATPWSTQYTFTAQALRSNESPDVFQNQPLDPLLFQNYPTEWDSSVQFGLTQPLLRGFGAAAVPVRKARLAIAAAEARTRQQADQVVMAVQQAYVALEQTAWQERATEAALDRSLKLYQRSKEKMELGLLSALDLVTSNQAVSTRQSALVAARAARKDAEEDLLTVVYGARAGAAALSETVALPAAPDLAVPVPVLPELPLCEARALEQRRNLTAGREELEALRQDLRVARDNLKPTLNLTASYTLKGTRNEVARLTAGLRPYDQGERGWAVGLSLGFPLLNRAAQGAARKAAVQVRQGELSLQSLEQEIQTSVRMAYRAIETGQERLAFAGSARDLAQRHYQGELDRMELGLTDTFRVTQVEEERVAAEQAALQACCDLLKAVNTFHFAMGESAQPYLP